MNDHKYKFGFLKEGEGQRHNWRGGPMGHGTQKKRQKKNGTKMEISRVVTNQTLGVFRPGSRTCLLTVDVPCQARGTAWQTSMSMLGSPGMRLASLPKPVATIIMHMEAAVQPKSLGGLEAVGNGQGLEVYHGM